MINKHFLLLILALKFSCQVQASPWVEADDAFLRSDIQFMADSNQLLMPTNTYPIRWSLFADQFSQIDSQQLSNAEALAYHNVQYRLDSERLGRGRSHLSISGATNSESGNNGFGGYPRTKAGINASHEILEDQFAFRVASGYRQAEMQDDRWNFDNSYFAVASRDISLSIGWIERWWGPGWQHSSGIGQQSYPLPAFAFSYQHPKLPFLGALWFETFIAKQDNTVTYDYISASRLALRPISNIQIGVTNKSWFGHDSSENRAQEWLSAVTRNNDNGFYSIDSRISSYLPWAGAGGIYGEQGSTKDQTLKYKMMGVDAQWLLGKQSFRGVIEFAEQEKSISDFYQQALNHKQMAIISIPANNELSIGSYWQFSTDQQLALFWHNTELDSGRVQRVTTQFKQPALAGLITLNMSLMNQKISDQDRHNLGVNYEYRFK